MDVICVTGDPTGASPIACTRCRFCAQIGSSTRRLAEEQTSHRAACGRRPVHSSSCYSHIRQPGPMPASTEPAAEPSPIARSIPRAGIQGAAAMTSTRTILLIGLPPGHQGATLASATVPDADMRAMIKSQLEALPQQMRDLGVESSFCEVFPMHAGGLDRRRDTLQGNPCDGIIIGSGVRSNMALTGWMEQIIDVIRTSAPDAKLLFNSTPALR